MGVLMIEFRVKYGDGDRVGFGWKIGLSNRVELWWDLRIKLV